MGEKMNVLKLILLYGFISMTINIYSNDIEVLVLAKEGSVYVKKPGKRFAESIKTDLRYGMGTLISTDSKSFVELLVSNNSIIVIPETSSWTVGDDTSSIEVRRAMQKQSFSLWNITIEALDRSNSSGTKSNVVGSIRVSGEEEPLEDMVLNEDDKKRLELTLKTINIIDDFARSRMKALIFESYGQYIRAEEEYLKAMNLATNNSSFNKIIDFLVTMLKVNDKPALAEEYLGLRRKE